MGIDFYDKWVEDEEKERKRIGGDMYDHRDDYVKRDEYNKLNEKFEKAKELLKQFVECDKEYEWNLQIAYEAEQFLKEVSE